MEIIILLQCSRNGTCEQEVRHRLRDAEEAAVPFDMYFQFIACDFRVRFSISVGARQRIRSW